MWLVVGLGNPSEKYELTRHNFGFLAIDALLNQVGVTSYKTNFSSQAARFELNSNPCLALKPQTFMNRSGTSVAQAMSFHKIAIDNVIILHDELDLPLGDMRIKKGGGLSGHNGLKDIARLIGPEFLRIRLGIGRPSIKGRESDYVLSRFEDNEFALVESVINHAFMAIKTIVTKGFDEAQKYCQTQVQKIA
jgi:peptidyl-tRNA hydrolase, PTH1 family